MIGLPDLEWLVSTRTAADVGALVFLNATLWLLCVIACGRLVRGRSAALRHRVWSYGLVGLLALPIVGSVVRSSGAPPLYYPAETALVGVESLEVGRDVRDVANDRVRLAREGPDPSPALPLPTVLLLCWWVGGTALSVRLGGGLARAARLRARSRSASRTHPAAELLEAERRLHGVGRPVRLLLSDERGLAATVGTLRPVVVLGRDVAALPTDRLRPVLIHELAHIRRGDFLSHLAAAPAMLLYWPNPLYWLVRKRSTEALELACDDEVLERGVRSTEYARLLLNFAVSRPGLTPALNGTAGVLRLSATGHRIHAVLDEDIDRARATARSRWPVLVSALAVLLPIASVRAFGNEPGTGPSTALVEAMGHPDDEVRTRAANTLGRRRVPWARAYLEAALDDPSEEVRLAAMSALHELGDPRSLAAIARVLERPFDDGAGEHGFVLKLAMKAAASIDGPEAAALLVRQLERPEAPLRWLAVEGVSSMQGQRPLALVHLRRVATSDVSERNRALALAMLRSLDATP